MAGRRLVVSALALSLAQIGFLSWIIVGRASITADDLPIRIDARRSAPDRERGAAELVDLLASAPEDGLPVTDIQEHFAGADVSWETVKAAKKSLGLKSVRVRRRDGKTAAWYWQYPRNVDES